MQREVETVALDVLRHAEADNLLEHAEDDQAGDGIIDEDDGDPDALIEELTRRGPPSQGWKTFPNLRLRVVAMMWSRIRGECHGWRNKHRYQ